MTEVALKKKGQWVDENGEVLTNEEVTMLKAKVNAELNAELTDTGLQGWIKRFVKRVVNN